MHLLALCLICGIASMCFGAAWFANLRADIDVNYMRLNAHDRVFSGIRDNLGDQIYKTNRVLEATQKAVHELEGELAIIEANTNRHVGALREAFESHKGSLQAHKKLTRGGRGR